jgi:ribosomal protein L16/L10AE
MGRGVGGLKYWAFYAKAGSTIVEINTNNTQSAVIALNSVKFKLGIKTHIKSMENRWML